MNICKILTSAKKKQHSGTRAIFWSNRITLSSLVNYIQLQFIFFKLQDWNFYERHGELATNGKLIPSLGPHNFMHL